MGTNLGVPFIASAAVKTGGQRGRNLGRLAGGSESSSLISGEEIKREKEDQDEKDPDSPEKALQNAISMLLGIVKDPESNDEPDEKEPVHQIVSPMASFLRSAFG